MTTTFNDTYEIKSIIGRGGMSTVYLAEHKRLHTRWAVKEVHKRQAARFDFLAESNILKKLQHPMLPRIVDIFEDPDSIYLVEDFVEGITLEDLLKRQKRIDEATGLQWFRDLCGVLGYLHRQQPHPIIYRDMKPSNVMLQPDGTLKLIDFGIAREYKQDSSGDTTYIGTKGYAAPEQFGKAQTDARTDIYSLGVTMYHLLTGKSPYEPPYQFVPARQLVPELSHGIEHILDKCIQPEPERRYQSVDELLDDLDHIYRYDQAWKKVQTTKRVRVAVLAVMLAASIGLMAGGQVLMAGEREDQYNTLLAQASDQAATDPEGAVATLGEARTLFPDRPESYRQETYVRYLSGDYQGCVDYGETVLETFPGDGQTLLTVASAYFELGDYETAAQDFYQGAQSFEMNADHLRDYAVCLGRTGDVEGAEAVLAQLTGQGTDPDVTTYIQGEVDYALGDYTGAEAEFLSVLNSTQDAGLQRRALRSAAELYRDCAALARTGASPIATPATKSAELLSWGIETFGLRYDSTLWELLALAYFEAYHTDPDVSPEFLTRSAECFNRVLELGVMKDYLYSNLYTIYYEQGEYDLAEQALQDYEAAFPQDYMPHALRGMLLITLENEKPQAQRDYSQALAEYETAGGLIRGEDDATYYQQLGSLIQQIYDNGWL